MITNDYYQLQPNISNYNQILMITNDYYQLQPNLSKY